MEIVKKGIETSEAECSECGTVLRYWPSEVKTEVIDRYIYRYPLKVPLYDYLVCPLCGRRIIISRYEHEYKHEATKSVDKQGFWRKIKDIFTKRGGNHASDKILEEREEKD